jgi:hypothetical protein
MKLKFMLLFLLAIVVGSTAFTADVTAEKKSVAGCGKWYKRTIQEANGSTTNLSCRNCTTENGDEETECILVFP